MITKLTVPDDPSINASADASAEASGLRIYPGPVLPSSLSELVAVAQNLDANILEIPEGEHVTLELAGPATIILAQPADFSWEREEPGRTTLLSRR